MDFALSNLKTAHVRTFEGLTRTASMEQAIEAIIDEFAWVQGLRRAHPDRYFVFFENEFTRDTLVGLADFLGLDSNDEWCDRSRAAFDSNKHYVQSPEVVSFYRDCVLRKFVAESEFKRKLLRFADLGSS